MNIAILTWLHNGNYGSILQAYALQRHLRDEGLDVENIDLHPTVLQKVLNMIRQHNPLTIFKDKWVAFRTRCACKDWSAIASKEAKFNEFLSREFNLTSKYRKFDDLKELSGKYDAYICGSDQIWSPMLLSPSYYFDFLGAADKRISYACSFGMSSIPSAKQQRIKGWLNRYDAISVREDAGLKIVKELTGRDAVLNVDPTMLLDASSWNKVVGEKPCVEGNYIFCYFLSYHKDQWEKSLKIAREKCLKVVVVPTTRETYSIPNATIIEDAGPEDWVNLVKNACMVCTDSFHGCVFSIIYKRQFVVFKRFADTNKLSQNTRVYTLLDSYGLRKCLVEDNNEIAPSEISDSEYETIHEKVRLLSGESKQWLRGSLGL